MCLCPVESEARLTAYLRGWRRTSCGTPDDLKALIDRAHELGILVRMILATGIMHMLLSPGAFSRTAHSL